MDEIMQIRILKKNFFSAKNGRTDVRRRMRKRGSLFDEIEDIADEKTEGVEVLEKHGQVNAKKQFQMTDFFAVKKK